MQNFYQTITGNTIKKRNKFTGTILLKLSNIYSHDDVLSFSEEKSVFIGAADKTESWMSAYEYECTCTW